MTNLINSVVAPKCLTIYVQYYPGSSATVQASTLSRIALDKMREKHVKCNYFYLQSCACLFCRSKALGLMRGYLHVILNMVTRKSFSPHIALWSWYKRNMAFCSDIMIIHSTKHSFTDLALIRK